MRKVNRLTGPAKSPWDERPIALVAAAIETESDPLSPRGAGRKVRRLPGGVADHPVIGGPADAFIALSKKPSMSSRIPWVSAKEQSAAAIGRHEQTRWLDSAPQNWHMACAPPVLGVLRD
jgi:hypothetical protein